MAQRGHGIGGCLWETRQGSMHGWPAAHLMGFSRSGWGPAGDALVAAVWWLGSALHGPRAAWVPVERSGEAGGCAASSAHRNILTVLFLQRAGEHLRACLLNETERVRFRTSEVSTALRVKQWLELTESL